MEQVDEPVVSDDAATSNKADQSAQPDTSTSIPKILIGTWTATIELDDAKLDKALEGAARDKAVSARLAFQMLKETKWTIVINADGAVDATVVGITNQKDTGKWTMLRKLGDTFKVKATDAKGRTQIADLRLLGEDRFTFSSQELDDGYMKPLVFVRDKTVPIPKPTIIPNTSTIYDVRVSSNAVFSTRTWKERIETSFGRFEVSFRKAGDNPSEATEIRGPKGQSITDSVRDKFIDVVQSDKKVFLLTIDKVYEYATEELSTVFKPDNERRSRPVIHRIVHGHYYLTHGYSDELYGVLDYSAGKWRMIPYTGLPIERVVQSRLTNEGLEFEGSLVSDPDTIKLNPGLATVKFSFSDRTFSGSGVEKITCKWGVFYPSHNHINGQRRFEGAFHYHPTGDWKYTKAANRQNFTTIRQVFEDFESTEAGILIRISKLENWRFRLPILFFFAPGEEIMEVREWSEGE